jgi:hypothetical protein
MSSDIPQGESPLFHVNDATETADSSHDTKPRPVSPFDHVNNKAETSGEESNAKGEGDDKDSKDKGRG